MIYPTSLRETVTSGTVVGGKLHADKTSASFITEAGCFLYRGGSNSEYAQSDLLKDWHPKDKHRRQAANSPWSML